MNLIFQIAGPSTWKPVKPVDTPGPVSRPNPAAPPNTPAQNVIVVDTGRLKQVITGKQPAIG